MRRQSAGDAGLESIVREAPASGSLAKQVERLTEEALQSYQDHMTTLQQNPLSSMPDNLPVFTMAQVAPAVGIAAGTLRAWMQRGHIKLGDRDSEKHTNGAPHKYTLRTILTLGITAELVGVGVPVNSAFNIAKAWEMMGDLPGEEGALARREPAGLFTAPYQTYLIVGPDNYGSQHREEPAHVFLAVDLTDLQSQARLASAIFARGRAGARAVWLNLVDHRVRSACEVALLGKNAPPEPDWEKVAAEIVASAEGAR